MRDVRDAADALEADSGGAPRSAGGVRRRHAVRRAADRAAAPRRGPDLRRSPRPRRAPLRARVLGPAPPSEGHRREPVAGADAGAARADDRARRWPRRGRPATGTPARSSSWSRGAATTATFYFLEMNTRLQVEHRGHRSGRRRRSGARAAARRLRRAAAVAAGRARRSAATRSRPASTPRIRRAASCRRPARCCSTASRAARRPRRLRRRRRRRGLGALRSDARQGDRVRPKRATRRSRGWPRALRAFPILGVRTNIPFLLRILEHPRVPRPAMSTPGFSTRDGAARSPKRLPGDAGRRSRGGRSRPVTRRRARRSQARRRLRSLDRLCAGGAA